MIPRSLTDFTNQLVPRYTSYPTAPQFGGSVDSSVYGGWLACASGAEDPISIYLHVPFCRSICHYCGCTTKAARRDAPLQAYGERLLQELELVSRRIGRRRVSNIHWGGGTPSMLPAETFRRIAAALGQAFDVAADAGHAIELDPRMVTAELAARLAETGVNRVSIGVQDFDPDVQLSIGRIQPERSVVEAIVRLRREGISDINLDLIYGLPRQTVSSIHATACKATALGPGRIALFGYAHTPWRRANQKLIDESALPDPALRIELAATAREAIRDAGYVAIGIDHFALPDDAMAVAAREGSLRRNFQGYTTDRAQTLIGLGASSISRLQNGYAQNAPDAASWGRMVDDGVLPIVRGVPLTPVDRLRAEIIERILCFFEVDLALVTRRYGATPAIFEHDLEQLEPLRRSGFIRYVGDRLIILRDGPALARIVASAFDAYLDNGARHSLAA